MSTLKVGGIRGVSASSDAITVANDGTCTVASGSKLNNCTTDGTTNLTIADGNLVLGTSGHGIDFSAASGSSGGSTSAVLSDYEEGTFTPVMHSNGGGGANCTYSQQSGRYTKIGRIVHIRFDMTWSGWSNASGQINVDNLPFINEGVGTTGGYGAPQVRDPSGVDSNIRLYGNSSYIGNSVNRIRLLAYNSSGTEVSCSAQSSGRMTGEAVLYVSV
jgi:hypothetical protein